MCELAAVCAIAIPSPGREPGSLTPVEKAAPVVVTGPTRVPAATNPGGIRYAYSEPCGATCCPLPGAWIEVPDPSSLQPPGAFD